MKVLFLDFDGVLNSAASFKLEHRRKNKRAMDHLSPVNCSNLQYILEQDSSVKIVISSTWRLMHSMVELQNILNSYGVEAARVIGKTPNVRLSGHRGSDIKGWLEENPNVTKFVILDDDPDAEAALWHEEGMPNDDRGLFIDTSENDGLQLRQAMEAARFFRGEK